MTWLEWLNAGAGAIAIVVMVVGASIYLNSCIKHYRERRQQALAHERKLHEDYVRLFSRDEKNA